MASAAIPFLNSRIAKNFAALVILQGGNYLLPLLLIPFLVRTLGLNTFGDWAFAGAFVAVFRTFVAYGFDLTATRAVSISREDRAFVGEVYTTVLLTRLLIFVLVCIALVMLGLAFANIQKVLALALLSMLVLVGEAFFPVWLFQGMERMSAITQLRLGYRALFVVTTMLLVRGPEDVFLIPVIEAVGSLGAGLIAMRLAYARYDLPLRWPRPSFAVQHVRDGASVFISNVAVHFYTTINTVLLGILASTIAVAQFSIAEKVYFAVRGMLGPVVQAVFPSLSRLAVNDAKAFQRAARLLSLLLFGCLVVLAGAIFLLADWIVRLIAGVPDPVAARTLQILAVALCFAMGSIFSALLVAEKKDKLLVRVTLITMVVNLIVVGPLTHYFGVAGAAFALLITQIVHVAVQVLANRSLLFGAPRAASTEPVA